MKHPRTAHVAKICAFVAAPLGLLLGMLLSSGQDLAGAGMIRGLMFIVGVGVSLLALLVCLVASVDLRAPRIPWPTIRRNRGKIAITSMLFLVPLVALYLM